MKLGLSSYTYTWAVGIPGSVQAVRLSAFDLVDKTVSAGLNLLQIADNLPLESWSDEKLMNLNLYAKKNKVALEMGGRGLTPVHSIHCLNAAEKLNSPVLRMVIDSPGYEPGIKTIISIIKDLVPELESRKIKLAIENHDRMKAREFAKIMNAVGSDFVGICLDSVNSMGAGEGFEEVSAILLPYTINLHIKDFTIRRLSYKMGIIIEGTPAGKGMLNIRQLLNILHKAKSCESAVLELWTPPEADIEETIKKEEQWAQESIDYLKKIVKVD